MLPTVKPDTACNKKGHGSIRALVVTVVAVVGSLSGDADKRVIPPEITDLHHAAREAMISAPVLARVGKTDVRVVQPPAGSGDRSDQEGDHA